LPLAFRADLDKNKAQLDNEREYVVMATGTVKWFNEKKGYGFIVPDGTDVDVFVHYSVIQAEGYKTLAEGERVEFEMTQDAKGARATAVSRLGSTAPA